jgi:superfamily II DNA/RNA helicase
VHERTTQFIYRSHSMDKPELVARVLQAQDRGLTMVFTRTKRTAQKVADDLAERGFAAAAVHGDLGQGAREQALRAFRSGKVDVLVATDVAARGIDVDDVTHVINYQTPEDEKNYVHRIGRTGRAGKTGVAITLVDWDEETRWRLISDALNLGIPAPVETYSTSKHLFSDLSIPADATGRLPLGKRTRAGLAAEPEEKMGRRRRSDTAAKPARKRRRTRAGAAGAEAIEAADAAKATETTDEDRPRRRRARGGESAPPTDREFGENPERPARRRRRRRVNAANTSDTPASAD